MGRAEQEHGLVLAGPHTGDLAGMMAGLCFFFERRILFVFHANEPKGGKGCKERRPWPRHDAGGPGSDATPDIPALRRRQTAVEYLDPIFPSRWGHLSDGRCP